MHLPFSFHPLATNLLEIEIVVKERKKEKIDFDYQNSSCISISIRDIRDGYSRNVVAGRYRTQDTLHRVVKQNSISLPRLDVILGN